MSFFERFFESQISITLSVAFVLVFLLWVSLLPSMRKYLNERKVNKTIQHLGSQYLKQVILPDGLGGSVFLDYLVLAQHSIILVTLKRFRGTIFCAENIEQWTQLIGNRSYKFPNTLQQLDSDILSVGSLVKDVDITGLVIFSSECDFPKGKPDQVKSIREIKNTTIDKQLHSESLLNAWYKLKDLTQNHLSTQSFAESYFKDQDTKLSYTLPIMLMVALSSWLFWRLYFIS